MLEREWLEDFDIDVSSVSLGVTLTVWDTLLAEKDFSLLAVSEDETSFDEVKLGISVSVNEGSLVPEAVMDNSLLSVSLLAFCDGDVVFVSEGLPTVRFVLDFDALISFEGEMDSNSEWVGESDESGENVMVTVGPLLDTDTDAW